MTTIPTRRSRLSIRRVACALALLSVLGNASLLLAPADAPTVACPDWTP